MNAVGALQKAECLLVVPEDVGGITDTLAHHLQDEDIVLLCVVALLDPVHLHLLDLPVRLHADTDATLFISRTGFLYSSVPIWSG
jgi:hypothetical protein